MKNVVIRNNMEDNVIDSALSKGNGRELDKEVKLKVSFYVVGMDDLPRISREKTLIASTGEDKMDKMDKSLEDKDLGFIKYGTDPSELGKIGELGVNSVSKKSPVEGKNPGTTLSKEGHSA